MNSLSNEEMLEIVQALIKLIYDREVKETDELFDSDRLYALKNIRDKLRIK